MVEEKMDEIRSVNKQKEHLEKEYQIALSQLENTKLELHNQIVANETLQKNIEIEQQVAVSELQSVKSDLEKQIATNASLNEKIEEQETRINVEMKRLMVFFFLAIKFVENFFILSLSNFGIFHLHTRMKI